jgi:hypothetical protein
MERGDPPSLKLRRVDVGIIISGNIGATGFEPAAFRPPDECATGLRHTPKSQN